MKKKVLALATVWLVAGFVSLEPARVPTDPGPTSVSSRVGQVVLGGIVVALSPVGALVGCGGGGGPTTPPTPRPTSATAVALL